MRGFAERRVRVADDGNGLCAVRASILDGGDGEGSASAGGDAYDGVFFCWLLPRDFFAAQLARVFIGLHGGRQRFGSASDDELDRTGVDIEGGRTFDGVESRNASAGAGAYVNEATALRERGCDQVDRLRDLRERALHGGRDLGIFTVDDARDFECGFAIEIGRGGVCFLGYEAAEFRGRCFADRRFADRRLADQRFAIQARALQAIFPKQPVV